MRRFLNGLKGLGRGIVSTVEDPTLISLAALGACVWYAHRSFGMNVAILVGMCLVYVRFTVKGKIV